MAFDLSGIGNTIYAYIPGVALWTIPLILVILIGGGIFYYQWRKNLYATYNVLCPILEPTQSGAALRCFDWGRRWQTENGEAWEFWTERPPVPVQPPDPDAMLGWSDKLYTFVAQRLGHDLPHGARFLVNETRPNRVVWGKSASGLCAFLYANNQYVPCSWDLSNLADARVRILKVPDLKVFLDEQRKLQLRHLMRTDKMLQYLPYILSGVLVLVTLIALAVFAWMHHKDTALMNQILGVGKESLATAKAMTTQQVNATVA